jgi:hypothetical protein
LPQVRCPQCGAVNSIEAAEYPFCVGCQDNLAKCGYCRWFESELVICTQPVVAGVFEVAVDATPPCDQHTPRENLLAPRRSIWPAIIIGAVALLVLFYSVFQFQNPLDIPPEAPQKELDLEIVGARKATVNQPFPIEVTITNVSKKTVGGIRLQVSNESRLIRFRLVKMTPTADAWEEAGEWRAYTYPDLAPGEAHHISLEVMPRQGGSYQFSVRLFSHGSTFIGMAQLPVQIADSPTPSDE